ncbi:CRISPR-associated endonuclease Cas3'' [Deinococcus sp.]|uniref:CRISPR-associated endonuclease Cas3'' n=1 Tax=Deinococcus sp. TaxID=47478 RepID=UPI003C7EB2ED
MTIYYGHTYPGDRIGTRWQLMKDHALNVARRARENAEPFGEGERAERAGKLHDLGKYGELFQGRLRGEGSGLDHWSVGACFVKQVYRDAGLTLVIQGHHVGLQPGDAQTLNDLKLDALVQEHPLGLRLTEAPPDEANSKKLLTRLLADGISLPAAPKISLLPGQTAADMLDTRMLFSSLVDADYLDTEEAMRPDDRDERPINETLDAVRALAALETKLGMLGQNSDVPLVTRELRADLMQVCREAGQADERLWTLTAPTGSGKTLAMLLFALTRAARMQATGRPVRRIVVVLPFLSILDQTVDEYRKLFGAAGFGKDFVLEHHSLAGIRTDETRGGQADGEADQPGWEARQFVQNWDAPVVITTSVQLLESLHANRPGACRKLHRLAHSIILMDEVQTLPAALAVPTLKTLARLSSEKYGAVVVMATATQPAFDTLSEAVRESGNDGWQPREMAPASLNLFGRARRVNPVWKLDAPTPWTTAQSWIREETQVLCIVNMRKHALELARALEAEPGLKHLSTYLCPAHRRLILKDIRAALEDKQEVRVVATQCVEAGVDLDFPKVFRALGPLDSIAQAAGRCNRHKKLESGELRVFLPEEEKYPTPAYRRAAQIALSMYRQGGLDLDAPTTFRRFYEWLWRYEDTDLEELRDAVRRQDYPEVSRLYRLIPSDSLNVVVPYEQGRKLIWEARQEGITVDWMRRVQPYTVSVFRPASGVLPIHLEPVNFRPRGGAPQPAADWYLAHEGSYDEHRFGYLPDGGSADPSTSY